MNTLTNKAPVLRGKSHILFAEKDIDFGIPNTQRREVLNLWRLGKSVHFISGSVKRNEHEVFLTLYEFWMERKIDDIERALLKPSTLLVPGKEQLEGRNEALRKSK